MSKTDKSQWPRGRYLEDRLVTDLGDMTQHDLDNLRQRDATARNGDSSLALNGLAIAFGRQVVGYLEHVEEESAPPPRSQSAET